MALALPAVLGLAGLGAAAQAPIPFPYTITTVAGGAASSTGSATAPVSCAAGSPYKSFDTYGNGCPGLLANFSADLRGGLASDGQGNIFIADTSNSMVRKYDPKSGLVTRVAGKGTSCTVANGLLDSSGDGCPQQQTSFASTPRGIATDPFGNVLFAGYGTNMVHVLCNAASPLCPATTGRKQVGSMYRVAGCVATVGGTATAASTTATPLNTYAGTEGDNSYASPFSNLAGDAGVSAGTVAGGTCSSTVGILNQPRGVAADRFGNVYIAETGTTGAGLRYRVVLGPQTYNGVTNPMFAIVNGVSFVEPTTSTTVTYTAHEGYIYTILGGYSSSATPTTAGGACGSYTATDTKGDGCPFPYSSANGGEQGIAVDNSGNVIFGDLANSTLRVLYLGGASAASNPMYPALVALGNAAPVAGNVYLLAGGGASAVTTTPALGNTVALSNGISKPTIGPGGNIYLGDYANSQVVFFDITTGYARVLFKTGTNGATFTGGSGLGVALDPLGNMYLGDTEGSSLLRKVEAVSLVPTTVGATALSQTLQFHGPKGTTGMTATLLSSPADITPGAITCAAANGDGTTDCTLPVTFAPAQPGPRTAQVTVTATGASGTLGAQVFSLNGLGQGTALVTDVAAPTTAIVGPTQASSTVAVDGAGSTYTDIGTVVKTTAAGTRTLVGTAPNAIALQTSVDALNNVYVTTSGSASIAEYALGTGGAYTRSTLTNSAITLPQAVAFDASGNAYIVDKATGSLFEVAAGNVFNTQQAPLVLATGFTNPVGVALDGTGAVYVADKGAPAVFKVASVNGVMTTTPYAANAAVSTVSTPGATAASTSPAVTVSGLVPVSIAADAGGNVYVQDSTSRSVIAIPAQQTGPATTTVLAGLTTPSGVAVDGNGVVYSADSGSSSGVVQVQRNAATFNFGTSTSTIFSGVLNNVGNINATGFQAAGLDTTTFPVTSVSPSNCFNATAIFPGYSCSITSQFTPGTGTGVVSSTLLYTVSTSTTGSLKLSGTKTGNAVTTMTTIGQQSPVNAVYSTAGTETTFPIAVTASDGSTPAGSVSVSIDSGASVAYTLTGGTVSVAVSGLKAGSHTIVAAYPTQSGLTGSTSSTITFTVAQATVTVTWNPGATTQQYSAAVGAGVLDASAAASGVAVPGFFVYTATPSGGTASPIHSASYLAIGTYGLSATFVPNDATDFTGGTGTVASYTVTKATTTASVGTTQNVVATDGTGNYTTVQAAVNALGATGGSVYIKPGTYTGDITVVQPNVALRGLGGDPTRVVLQHAGGAFGGSGVYMYAGEFTTAQANGSQLPTGSSIFNGDEGSATLVVAKGVNTALGTSTLTPNGFFGENFTLNNTYDTDTATTTTTYLPAANSGTCTANEGPARTYNDLYNNSLLCASQALAIWTTSDLAVMNNVYTGSLQDTIYAGSQGNGANGYVPARQYWFRGKVAGDVDYIFGDAASVWDYTTIYSLPHGTTLGGTITIEAQNKAVQTGVAGDYLSGYVMNSNVFTSSQAGFTAEYFGRPYGVFSTWAMLNSYVDQVTPAGYIEFSGSTNSLPSSTYVEYNDIPYTDPATNAADVNGVLYLGAGGNSGAGVTGPRETVSQDPGTVESANAVKTALTQAQAQQYFPNNFLGQTVSATFSSTSNWVPTAALAANVNAFVPATSVTAITFGQSLTVLMRPQTPGLGAITNGVYTVPTGTYSLLDNGNIIASGTLDASGEATYTSATFAKGTHNLSWTYGGDNNFGGSTTSNALVLTVAGVPTATTLSPATQNITYGQSASVTATVATTTGYTPTGTVTLTIDGSTTQVMALTGGTVVFSVAGLNAGSHSFTASYAGDGTTAGSVTTAAVTATVAQAVLTVTGMGANRVFGAQNMLSVSVAGYQNGDTASAVFSVAPTVSTTATRVSAAGTYPATPAATLSAAGSTNYTLSLVSGSFAVSGGAAQRIFFAPLPNLAHGSSYQLTARASSGLTVTYTVTGNATVSGSTLNVTGTGLITVTAMQSTDPTGDYAAATAVARSFTAQ